MPKTQLLPKPSLKEKVIFYVNEHWQHLLVALSFAFASTLMAYTLLLQSTVMGIKISPLLVYKTDAYYSPLTGVEVPQALTERPVTAIMIENSPDARPQSSLSEAGIVFEAVAEGGITRYLALYQETRPKVIGPVRSLRPYYLDWAMGFDANLVHAGGSGEALSKAKQRGAKSMNGLVFADGYYRTGDRTAPHNLYTSASKLDALAKRLGYLKPSKFESYSYTRKDRPAQSPTATNISLGYSGGLYATQFKYSASKNNYLRYLAGNADKDRENNRQISVKNVVVVPMPTTYSGSYAVMKTIGSGNLIVFKNGTAIKGTWKKDSPGGQFQILDQEGKPITLNAGSTWISVVPAGSSVRY